MVPLQGNMERKIKIGDKVLLTKPKENNGDIQVDPLIVWRPDMGAYIGKIFTVKSIDLDDNTYLCECGDVNFWARESWLTKIEMNPNEQEPQQCCEKRGIEPVDLTKKQVDLIKKEDLSNIDWEQRRWELASKIYAEMENITLESAVRQAEIFIKYYKQTLK